MQDNDNTRPTDHDGPEHSGEESTHTPLEEVMAGEELDETGAASSPEAEHIAELEAALATAKDQQLRALADVENMRRRTQREREEALKYGAVSLARDLLAVADNLNRALAAAQSEADNNANSSLVEGIAMVAKDLDAALEKHHVKPVPGIGEPFDPNVHQAVVELESADVPPGHVVQVMQSGYTLHDRLLRPAMVAVSKQPSGDASPSSA